MSIVIDVIAEYLVANRKLVVPAFGAFMVKESGERVFSELLRTDDGVLASLLYAKGLNEMEAAVTIDRFIFEVRSELEQYGYCRLDVLGTLRVEPDSGVVRLYPQVVGEEPKQMPYVPKSAEVVEESSPIEESVAKEETPVEEVKPIEQESAASKSASQRPRRVEKPRRRFDFVMFVAMVVILAALAVVGYGLYTSGYFSSDDESVEQIVTPTEEPVKE